MRIVLIPLDDALLKFFRSLRLVVHVCEILLILDMPLLVDCVSTLGLHATVRASMSGHAGGRREKDCAEDKGGESGEVELDELHLERLRLLWLSSDWLGLAWLNWIESRVDKYGPMLPSSVGLAEGVVTQVVCKERG